MGSPARPMQIACAFLQASKRIVVKPMTRAEDSGLAPPRQLFDCSCGLLNVARL